MPTLAEKSSKSGYLHYIRPVQGHCPTSYSIEEVVVDNQPVFKIKSTAARLAKRSITGLQQRLLSGKG